MNNKDLCIIFVEGDAEEILFNKLKQIYLSEGCRCDIKVINMNTGGYANQVAGKLRGLRQNDKYKDCNFKVVCCEYDTDVYEKLQRKKPNWTSLYKSWKKFHIEQCIRIEAKSSIESWMLDDKDNLIKALGLNISGEELKNLSKGKTSQEVVKALFKKRNKIYDKYKGKHNILPYLDKLNISKIRDCRESELFELEALIGLKEPQSTNT